MHLANKEYANNTFISSKTADSSSITKENKRTANTIDKNTCTSENLLKEDIEKVSGTKKNKGRETSNFLRQDDKRTEINNLINKVNTLQFVPNTMR